MKLNFPTYNNQHKSQIINLLGSARYKKKLWDWQFTHPSKRTWKPVIATNEDNKVLGFNAVMPTQIYYKGSLIDAAWSCDFIVDASCRGKGLGQKIKQQLHSNYPLLFSLGISDQAVRVLEKMGWKAGTSVIAYRKRNHSGGIKGQIIRLIQRLNQTFTTWLQVSPSSSSFEFSLSSHLPEKELINELSEKCTATYEKTIKRDYNYLNWRYQLHPLASYDFICIWNGAQLMGLGILRSTDKQSTLVDYLGPKNSPSVKLKLIEAWQNYYPEVEAMNCTSSDIEIGMALKQFGFRAAQKQRFYVYGTCDDCAKNWFIMGGDSDGEILQAAMTNTVAQ